MTRPVEAGLRVTSPPVSPSISQGKYRGRGSARTGASTGIPSRRTSATGRIAPARGNAVPRIPSSE
eukprot:648675-Pyramimonas_sp.AAC.1